MRYPYNSRPGMVAVGLVFLTALALFTAYLAMTNQRGLVLNGLIHLAQHGASVFYASLAAVMSLGMLLMLQLLYRGMFSTLRVTLSASAIQAPKSGVASTTTTINLADVRQAKLQTVNNQRRLCLSHTRGKLLIHEACLPEQSDFDTLCQAFGERLAAVNKPLA